MEHFVMSCTKNTACMNETWRAGRGFGLQLKAENHCNGDNALPLTIPSLSACCKKIYSLGKYTKSC